VLSVGAVGAGILVAARLALELLMCLGFIRVSNYVGFALAALSSICFVLSGLVLLRWRPTASLGRMLIDRFLYTRENWETDTLRSFSEVGIWLSVVWSTYGASERDLAGVIAALLCGTLAGCLLAVVGEALQEPLRDLERCLRKVDTDETLHNWESGSLFLLMLFGFSAISTIYENSVDIIVGSGLAALAGLLILTVAKLIQVWEPTRRAGNTLQARVCCISENWRLYPLRSALETMSFASVVIGVYAYHGVAVCALQAGALAGISLILASEIAVSIQGHCAAQVDRLALVSYGGVGLVMCFFALDFVREGKVPADARATITTCIAYMIVSRTCFVWEPTCHAGTVLTSRAANCSSNWAEHPVRSMIETSVWLAAQWAGQAATGSAIAAAASGTLAAVVVVLCSDALGVGEAETSDTDSSETAEVPPEQSHKQMVLSVTAVAAGIVVAARLAVELCVFLGFIRTSNASMAAFASLSCFSFVACALVLLRWRHTADLGQMLIDRVVNTRENWERDTLRSFCEVLLWLTVIWSSFHATCSSGRGLLGFAFAVMSGTLAGCLLAVVGEALREPLREVQRCFRQPTRGEVHLESGSMMLLMLFGYSAIHTIHDQCTDFLVGIGLATTAGIAIVTLAELAQVWQPTRVVGTTLQKRVLCASENWKLRPLRSALESTSFASVVIGVYALHGNVLLAFQAGTLAGIAVVLTSEIVSHVLEWTAVSYEEARLECVACAGLGIIVSSFARDLMLDGQVGAIGRATVTTSLVWVFAGKALLHPRTRRIGTIITQRAANCSENWAKHPVRSVLEVGTWFAAQFAGYAATESVVAAAAVGTTAALAAVSLSEAMQWRSTRVLSKAPKMNRDGSPVSAEEVAKHASEDDAWLIIDSKVYDVTSFAPTHPGGTIIYKFAGHDATDQFAAFHRPQIAKRLRPLLLCELEGVSSASEATKSYRALREKLWREGYFKPSAAFYIGKAVVWIGLIVLSAALVCLPGCPWSRTAVAAAMLGLGWHQAALMTHDACHRGVDDPDRQMKSGEFNFLGWFAGAVIFGVSPGMWQEEHSMHHAITRRPREDPQFNYLPLWLISHKELEVPGAKLDFFTRVLVSVQHYTFLPLTVLVGRFNFHLVSVLWTLKAIVTARSGRQFLCRCVDLLGMVLYFTWYVALTSQLDAGVPRVIFVLTSNWVTGLLHVQLLLSHLCVECFTAEEERAEEFFSFQLKTSRNINSSWYDHWFHGGLDYQIEHHLFPQLPRHNLKKVKPFVMEICKQHGIPYRSDSFSSVLLEVLRDFRKVALEVATLQMG